MVVSGGTGDVTRAGHQVLGVQGGPSDYLISSMGLGETGGVGLTFLQECKVTCRKTSTLSSE